MANDEKLTASPGVTETRNETSSFWEGIALRFASFGAGFAVMFCLIAGFAWWYQSRPRAWNQRALTANFGSLELTTNPNGPNYEADFIYVLENNTGSNYVFKPFNLVVMAKQTGDVLSKEFGHDQASDVSITGATFIPPRGKGKITIRVPYQYPADFTTADKANIEKVAETLNRRLKEMSGLVIFDRANHYRVDLPEGWSNFSPSTKAN